MLSALSWTLHQISFKETLFIIPFDALSRANFHPILFSWPLLAAQLHRMTPLTGIIPRLPVEY